MNCELCDCPLEDGKCQRHTCPNFKRKYALVPKSNFKALLDTHTEYIVSIAKLLKIPLEDEHNLDGIYEKIKEVLTKR